MITYDLYVESGPKHRKTYIHVPQIVGCVARGATTDDAVAASPAAIRTFLRFLLRHGEPVDPDAAMEVCIAEHITEGISLGDGFPYVTLATDFEPLDKSEIDRQMERARWILEEAGRWASEQNPDDLRRAPSDGKSSWDILLHILSPQGSFLAWAFGRAPGFTPIKKAAESGNLPIDQAFLQSWELCVQRIEQASPDQWNAVREMSGYVFNLRKALRRMNEHPWEHLIELSERSDGPHI